MIMKNTIIKTALFLFAALSFVGCETVVEFKGEYMEPQMVLYSVVTADEPVRVYLSNSVFVLDEATPSKQTGAEVELYVDGEFVERLTEVDYDEVITEVVGDYVYTETINHHYYEGKHTCSSGDEVEIRARHQNFEGEVRGKTIIPEKAHTGDLSATISPQEEDEYSSSTIKGNVYCPITDEAGVANYYLLHGYVRLQMPSEDNGNLYYYERWFGYNNEIVFTGADTNEMFEDLLGNTRHLGADVVFDDSLIDGEEDYPLTMTYGFLEEESVEEPIFRVECWQIDDNLYKYLRSVELAESDNFISEPVQIHSNIEGGIGLVGSRSALVLRTLPFSEAKR